MASRTGVVTFPPPPPTSKHSNVTVVLTGFILSWIIRIIDPMQRGLLCDKERMQRTTWELSLCKVPPFHQFATLALSLFTS